MLDLSLLPNPAVRVDHAATILTANPHFAEMAGGDSASWSGTALARILPSAERTAIEEPLADLAAHEEAFRRYVWIWAGLWL